MKLFIKISTLLLCQFAGFFAAVFAYEVIKIIGGTPYTKAIWGIDIPYIYQTEKIYIYYCSGISIWFLILCFTGVITSLKNKKIIPVLVSLLIYATVFLLVFLNGRY